MSKAKVILYVVAAGMLLGLPGCDRRQQPAVGATQTKFPGQVSSGGGSSGEVMGRVGPTKDGTYAGGTPGIAGGSGGNTGGAATGGSVQETGRGPSHGVTAPAATPQDAAAAKKAQAAAQAEKDKQALLASMDTVAGRWRSNATTHGRQVHAPTPIAAPAAAVAAPTTQAGASGQPGGQMGSAAKAAPVTSEKAGTAPPAPAGR
ncbi:hypothetical protein [Janthinobacterium sp. 17J80-10]|uniref:hypothetical protein n=1 Tax=Janthinobacterium sp. 17J80-10 TaxID=2497863 RepID=UPI0019D71BDA|nr:hypothetical protein [Janthinobacterium sp. 17J80-10]